MADKKEIYTSSNSFDKTVKAKKKQRRHNKAVSIAVILLILLLGTYFCFSKLFVFKNFKVVENGAKGIYSQNQVFEGLGLEKGITLSAVDIKAAESRAVYSLPYADVKLKKSYPSSIVATLNYRTPMFYVNVDNNLYVLSENLVVLDKTDDIEMIEAKSLVFLRFSAVSKCVEGEKLELEAEMEEIFTLLVEELKNADMLTRISEINMENKYDISLMHDTRYSVKIGDRTNLEKKILLMKTVIDDKISVGETGSVDVTDEDIKIVVFKKH